MEGLPKKASPVPARSAILSWVAAAPRPICLSSWAAPAAPAAASTPVVVTIGFDDGTVDQFTQAYPILASHNMHATFFVNTGPILAGDPSHMTWADLHTLSNAGNEITGRSEEHRVG